jgi:hypothetical protein
MPLELDAEREQLLVHEPVSRHRLREQQAGDDRRAARAEPATDGDLRAHLEPELARERNARAHALECHEHEILAGLRQLALALAAAQEHALGARVHAHVEEQPEREPQEVEARPEVGGRSGDAHAPARLHRGIIATPRRRKATHGA